MSLGLTGDLPNGSTEIVPCKVADEIAASEVAPRVLPVEWRREANHGPLMVYRSRLGLLVLLSVQVEVDGKRWIHASMSRRNRLPDYNDMVRVKDTFIGVDRTAVQIFPSRDRHINIHPNCLHLWSCLDAEVMPDFRHRDPLTGAIGI